MKDDEKILLNELIGEVRLLFHRLARAADALHESDGIPASQRAVLECLCKGDSKTVPQIASMKSVSRQHIQVIVNELSEKKMVEITDNPKHKRSPLVGLSDHGIKIFKKISRREAGFLTGIDSSLEKSNLEISIKTLSALNEIFMNKGEGNEAS